ncbi:MAG: glycosyltransferase [Microbacterium sp.]|nr:glycosyltransferase [Microbacterium sp.]
MHVVFTADQHLASGGGAQVSMRLQRAYLRRAGWQVSVVTPWSAAARRQAAAGAADAGDIVVPGIPLTVDREYGAALAGSGSDRVIDTALASRPAVDLVHVQGDFWGAFHGYRLAARQGVPVVHTFHNHLGVGLEATVPAPRLVLRGFAAWQRRALGGVRRDGVAGYLGAFADRADAVVAPSSHFAEWLQRTGIAREVEVIPTGVDDDLLQAALAVPKPPLAGRRPRLLWLGRFSAEKRPVEFARALVAAALPVDVELVGGGSLAGRVRRILDSAASTRSASMPGRVPYADALARIRRADAVVLTSVGFETQGMTAYEAAALGTPALIADPVIAAELPGTNWTLPRSDDFESTLAAGLRRAVAELESGSAPVPDPSWARTLRQSVQTRRMLHLYARASAP